jgi:DNA-binding NarL/FixJ family response regulator
MPMPRSDRSRSATATAEQGAVAGVSSPSPRGEFARAASWAAGASQDWMAGAAAVVGALPGAALLVDRAARVVAANATAHRVMADSPLFIDVADRLRASIPRIEEAVVSALDAAAGGPQVARVTDFGPRGDILLSVSPLPGEAADMRLVTIAGEVTEPSAVLSAMRRLYGLDELEAAVAFAIYSGQRVHQFAEMHGIDVYTASMVQDRLMRRLGAHRASDVARRVALVSQAAPPARPEGAE